MFPETITETFAEVVMFIRYSFSRLAPNEQMLIARVLLDEMQVQGWFGIAVSSLLKQELVVSLH